MTGRTNTPPRRWNWTVVRAKAADCAIFAASQTLHPATPGFSVVPWHWFIRARTLASVSRCSQAAIASSAVALALRHVALLAFHLAITWAGSSAWACAACGFPSKAAATAAPQNLRIERQSISANEASPVGTPWLYLMPAVGAPDGAG